AVTGPSPTGSRPLARPAWDNGAMTTVGPAAMSAREAEVLDAVGERLTNAEIAQRLHISVRTVESHVSSLLRKMGAADRRELAAQATSLGAVEHTAPLGFAGLPNRWTSFVGRPRQIAETIAAIESGRIVTLLGRGDRQD